MQIQRKTNEEKLADYALYLEQQEEERDRYEKEQEALRKKWATEAEANRVYNTWDTLVREEMERVGEEWDEIEAVTPSLKVLTTPYVESGFMPDGVAFTIWTNNRVYFPVWEGLYDEGFRVVQSAPRHPSNEAIQMLGDT